MQRSIVSRRRKWQGSVALWIRSPSAWLGVQPAAVEATLETLQLAGDGLPHPRLCSIGPPERSLWMGMEEGMTLSRRWKTRSVGALCLPVGETAPLLENISFERYIAPSRNLPASCATGRADEAA